MPIHKFKNLELFYRVYGEGDCVLLFIHGLGGNGNSWKHQLDYFRNKYPVIAVDLFGHGQSSKDVDPVFAPRIDAEAIYDLMRNKIEKPYFAVGHSFASFIIPEIIKLNDSNLKGAVFVDCAYQGHNDIIEARVTFANSMLNFSDAALQIETRKWYREMIAENPDEEEVAFISSTLKDCNLRWLFRSVAGAREFSSRYPHTETPVRDNLPVFIMEAENGIGDDLRRSWINHFKNAKYYLFEDGYHFFFITEHGKFNRLLDEFLNENSCRQR